MGDCKPPDENSQSRKKAWDKVRLEYHINIQKPMETGGGEPQKRLAKRLAKASGFHEFRRIGGEGVLEKETLSF